MYEHLTNSTWLSCIGDYEKLSTVGAFAKY